MSVIFSYNLTTVEIRNPELSDSLTGILGTASIIAMTGAVRAYRKSVFPERLLLNFVELDCGEMDEMIAFIKESSGQIVTFVDWLGRTLRGYITNNPFEVSHTSNTRDQFTIEFEILEIIPAPSVFEEGMLMEDSETMLFEDSEIMLYEG